MADNYKDKDIEFNLHINTNISEVGEDLDKLDKKIKKQTVNDSLISAYADERMSSLRLNYHKKTGKDLYKDRAQGEIERIYADLYREAIRDKREGRKKIPGVGTYASGYIEGSAKEPYQGVITTRNFGSFVGDNGEIVPGMYKDSQGNYQSSKTIAIRHPNLSKGKDFKGIGDLDNKSLFGLNEAYEQLINLSKTGTPQAQNAKKFAETIVKSIQQAYNNTKEEELRQALVESLSKMQANNMAEIREDEQLIKEGKQPKYGYTRKGELFDKIRETSIENPSKLSQDIKTQSIRMSKLDSWGDMDNVSNQKNNPSYSDESIKAEESSRLNKIIDQLLVSAPQLKDMIDALISDPKFDMKGKLEKGDSESVLRVMGDMLSQAWENGNISDIQKNELVEQFNPDTAKTLGSTGRDVVISSPDAVELNANVVSLDALKSFKGEESNESIINDIEDEYASEDLEVGESLTQPKNSLQKVDMDFNTIIRTVNRIAKNTKDGNSFDEVVKFIKQFETATDLMQSDIGDKDLNKIRDFIQEFFEVIDTAQSFAMDDISLADKEDEIKKKEGQELTVRPDFFKNRLLQLIGSEKDIESSFTLGHLTEDADVVFSKFLQIVGDANKISGGFIKGEKPQKDIEEAVSSEKPLNSSTILKTLATKMKKTQDTLAETDDSFIEVAQAAQSLAKMLEQNGVDAKDLKNIGMTAEKGMSSVYNAIANALNFPEMLQESIKKRVDERNFQAGKNLFSYEEELKKYKLRNPEEAVKLEATQKAKQAWDEVGGLENIEIAVQKALSVFSESGVKGLSGLEEAFKSFNYLINKKEAVLDFDSGNDSAFEEESYNMQTKLLESLYARMDRSGFSSNPDKYSGKSYYERNSIVGENIEGTPLQNKSLSPSEYTQLVHQAGYTGFSYGGKTMEDRLNNAIQYYYEILDKKETTVGAESDKLEADAKATLQDIKILKEAGATREISNTNPLEKPVLSIEERRKIEEENSRKKFREEQEKTKREYQSYKKKQEEAIQKSEESKKPYKINNKRDIKWEEPTIIGEQISKENEDFKESKKAIDDHAEAIEVATNAESEKITVSQDLSRKLKEEEKSFSDIGKVAEAEELQEPPFKEEWFPSESDLLDARKMLQEAIEDEERWNNATFDYREEIPDLSYIGKNLTDSLSAKENPDKAIKRILEAGDKVFEHTTTDQGNRIKQYTKELSNQVKAYGKIAEFLAREEVLQEQINNLEKNSTDENQEQLQILKQMLNDNSRKTEIARGQYKNASVAIEETGLLKDLQQQKIHPDLLPYIKQIQTNALIARREVVTNATDKGKIEQQLKLETQQRDVIAKKVKAVEESYKKQLKYQKEIAKINAEIDNQLEPEQKESVKKRRILKRLMKEEKAVVGQYDKKTGLLNGIQLSDIDSSTLNKKLKSMDEQQKIDLIDIKSKRNTQEQEKQNKLINDYINKYKNLLTLEEKIYELEKKQAILTGDKLQENNAELEVQKQQAALAEQQLAILDEDKFTLDGFTISPENLDRLKMELQNALNISQGNKKVIDAKIQTESNKDESKKQDQAIKSFKRAYESQLRYERDIAKLRKEMSEQSGVELRDSEKQLQALNNQLNAVTSITSGYDRQSGKLNGIKLSEEKIKQLNEIIDNLQLEQAKKLTQINTQYSKQQGLLTQIVGGFKTAFKNITDASLAYSIINQIKRVISEVIDSTKELDKALVDIQIATGQTRKATKELLIDYSALAKEMGRTTQSVAIASNDWLRAGYEGKEAAELTRASMMLSTLGMIDATDATTYLISTLKGWRLEAQDVIEVTDKLTAVDMAAAISAGDLALAMSRANSSARIAGSDMNNFIGYVTTIADRTQKSAESVGES